MFSAICSHQKNIPVPGCVLLWDVKSDASRSSDTGKLPVHSLSNSLIYLLAQGLAPFVLALGVLNSHQHWWICPLQMNNKRGLNHKALTCFCGIILNCMSCYCMSLLSVSNVLCCCFFANVALEEEELPSQIYKIKSFWTCPCEVRVV